MAASNTTQPPSRRGAARGLRNKRSPSQQTLQDQHHPSTSQRGGLGAPRISAGSASYRSILEPAVAAATAAAASSSTTTTKASREPQFLAAPSVHSSRRDHMAVQHSRRGLRHNKNQYRETTMVRKVSESSLVSSGSNHSSRSMEDNACVLEIHRGRPSLNREISGLGESSRSFFCDESFRSDHFEVPNEVPNTSYMMNSSSTTSYMNSSSATNMTASHQERRTFEDISMQAQFDGTDPSEQEENYEMEISPGVYLPFRGSQETWRAVYNGNTLETTCLECNAQLVSVADCQCVVCSECRMVNPVFEHPPNVQTIHGAGLGLQKEWIINQRRHDFSRRRYNM